MVWPAAVSEDFLGLISTGDDVSLLIFIYWCAVIYQSPRRWFITAWAKRAAVLALGMLNGDWSSVLVWPVHILELVLPVIDDGPFSRVGECVDPVPTQVLTDISLHEFPVD